MQLGVVVGLSCAALAEAPPFSASSPADTQAVINTAVVRLSDRDPAVRDAAREELMGLSLSDLTLLRMTVQQMRPLPPGVGDTLHKIVSHVYLASENDDGDPSLGFMGVQMSDLRWVPADDEGDSELALGVVVESRLPGFAASRFLRDGDIVLAISTDGAALIPVHSSRDIMEPVSRLKAGQQVRLQIIRHGRRIEKILTLDARPRELEGVQAANIFESFRKVQDQKSDDFWSSHFASVVDENIS